MILAYKLARVFSCGIEDIFDFSEVKTDSNPFFKETLLINRLLLVGVATIILVGTAYYGKTVEDWLRIPPILALIVLAFFLKERRIKRRSKDLDERLQAMTHQAVSTGFYAVLAVVFWFWTKELVQDGTVSTRTIMELAAAVVGIVGSYLYLRTKM